MIARGLAAAAVGVMLAASAQAAILNSFDSTSGITNPGGVSITVATSVIGLTEGTGSLAATKGNGWGFIQFDITPAQYASILSDQILKIDYTYTAPMADFGWWGSVSLVVNSATINAQYGGWRETASTSIINPPAPGTQNTFTFDTSTMGLPATPGNWQNMAMVLNWGGASPQTAYFDNLRTVPVPEPTVIAGLVASSLGLMIRRRQK